MNSVLVIDDDPVVCAVIERVLEGDGFSVTSAGDAQTGISRFTEMNPDLVIVDILMPGKEGIATILELREAGDACARTDPHLAPVGKDFLGYQLQQRGLAFAVAAEQANAFAPAQLQADIVEQRLQTEAEVEGDVAERLDSGRVAWLRVLVSRTFPLADAVDAHRLIAEGHVAGKIALIP